MFKKLGRIVSAPVRIPIRKAKEKVMVTMIAKFLRYGVTAVGGATVAVSDDQYTQAAGAVAALVSFGLSVYKDMRDARAVEAKP
jgi:hypothetical protein